MLRDDLYDDFCVLPARPEELVAFRLQHLFWRAGPEHATRHRIEYGPSPSNLEDLTRLRWRAGSST